MAIGNASGGKKFTPFQIFLADMVQEKEITVTWELLKDSKLKLKYRFMNQMQWEIDEIKKEKLKQVGFNEMNPVQKESSEQVVGLQTKKDSSNKILFTKMQSTVMDDKDMDYFNENEQDIESNSDKKTSQDSKGFNIVEAASKKPDCVDNKEKRNDPKNEKEELTVNKTKSKDILIYNDFQSKLRLFNANVLKKESTKNSNNLSKRPANKLMLYQTFTSNANQMDQTSPNLNKSENLSEKREKEEKPAKPESFTESRAQSIISKINKNLILKSDISTNYTERANTMISSDRNIANSTTNTKTFTDFKEESKEIQHKIVNKSYDFSNQTQDDLESSLPITRKRRKSRSYFLTVSKEGSKPLLPGSQTSLHMPEKDKSQESNSLLSIVIHSSSQTVRNTSHSSMKVNPKLYELPSTLLRGNTAKFTEESDGLIEGFFIAGLPKSSIVYIDDSEDWRSLCKHDDCSKLPACQAEILFRYPPEDTKKLEINRITASCFFPLGIKLCYTSDESTIRPLCNPHTTITTLDGTRFYIASLTFYVKMDKKAFDKEYDLGLANHYLQFNHIIPLLESAPKLQKKYIDIMEKKLDILTSINFNDYVYVPFTMCMISKHPYLEQMSRILGIVLNIVCEPFDLRESSSVMNSFSQEYFFKFLTHLVKEIQVHRLEGNANRRLCFYLPTSLNDCASLNSEISNNPALEFPLNVTNRRSKDSQVMDFYLDLPLIDELPLLPNTFNLVELLEFFKPESIITIVHLMLLEQKILFVSSIPSLITKIIDALISLLYPLQWNNTLVPLLSEEMVKYVQSFMPYIMGIEKHMLPFASEYLAEDDSIFLVHIDEGCLDISRNSEKAKKSQKKDLLKGLPAFINDIWLPVITGIQSFKGKPEMEFYFRTAFVRALSKLFGDFQKYLSFLDNMPLFNSESFIQSRPNEDREFYNEFIQTQLFRQFLQTETKENFPYFFGIGVKGIKKHSNSIKKFSKTTSLKDEPRQKEVKYDEQFIIFPYFVNKIKYENTYKEETQPKLQVEEFLRKYYHYRDDLSEDYPIGGRSALIIDSRNTSNLSSLIASDSLRSIHSSDKNTYTKFNFPSKFEKPQQRKEIAKGIKKKLSVFTSRGDELSDHIKTNNLSRKKDNELQEQDHNYIKELLNDYLTKILTSDPLSNQQKENLENLFTRNFSVVYFAEKLYQGKFKENKSHCLVKESFIDLLKLISKAMWTIGDNTKLFHSAMLITKSMFHYYREYKGEFIYLYKDHISKNKALLGPWKQINFWIDTWFPNDLKLLKQNNTNLNKTEDMKFSVIMGIASVMCELNIDLKIILKVLYDRLASDHIHNEIMKESIKHTIVKQCNANNLMRS